MNLAAPTIPVTAGALPVTVPAGALPVTVPTVPVTVPSVRPPLLSPTLMSTVLLWLAGVRYTPITKSDFKDKYDYIIVGSGSAGSVVANRLSEVACVSVLLLEAGETPPPTTEIPAMARSLDTTDFNWGYKTVPQKYCANAMINQQVQWPSGKAIGGTSILNEMYYDRGNHRNYDNWAAAGAVGWSYNDVLPYFIKSENNTDASYVDSGYHGNKGPIEVHQPWYTSELKDPILKAVKNLGYNLVDSNGARQTGFYDFQATMRGGKRCSAAKAYLVPAENRTNLDIVKSAMVRKVIIENNRAVGVEVDYNGQTRVVRARKEVILSAGTVNNAQLLMLSGIGPKDELTKHNIPIVADLPVGKNYHNHAFTALFYEIINRKVKPVAVKAAAGTQQYFQTESGPLASTQFLFLSAFLKDNETHPADDFPNHHLYQGEAPVDILQFYGVKPDVYAKTFAPYAGKPMLVCVSKMLQPRSRGTVTLQSPDPYTPPIMQPNFYKDPQDVKAVVAGMKNCNRLYANPPVKNFKVRPMKTLLSGCEQYGKDTDDYLECYARSFIMATNHQVGTAKMGDPNDPTTVVDPQLRVKNIVGLRVVDASVMPIITSSNTNIPAYMIAEKASDMIKSVLKCGCKKSGKPKKQS